jgi:integrase
MPFKRAGSEKWYIVVGGVRRSSGTADFDDAKALENKLNHQAWLEERMGVKPPRSWNEAVAKYLPEVRHQAGIKVKAAMLDWWGQYLGGVEDIRLITRDTIDDILTLHYVGAKGKRITPGPSPQNHTANHYVAVVSTILNAACREWDWIERVPKFRRYPSPEGKTLALTVEMWREMEKALPERLRLFCTLALATGLRDGKLWRLEWSQVDVQKRVLSVSGNAIKRGVTIPLNRTATEALEAIRGGSVVNMRRVFPEWRQSTINQHATAFARLRKVEGLEAVGVHTLRHTFNTWLARAGVSQEVRARLVGHSTGTMNDRYTHWDVEWLRPYASVIDAQLGTQSEQISNVQSFKSTFVGSGE